MSGLPSLAGEWDGEWATITGGEWDGECYHHWWGSGTVSGLPSLAWEWDGEWATITGGGVGR